MPVASSFSPSLRPQLGIIGQANVGKSTLFNRLLGSRRALVYDMPGVTRDWQVHTWNSTTEAGDPFTCALFDTPGLMTARDTTSVGVLMQQHPWHGLLWIVDGKEPLDSFHYDVARWIRRYGFSLMHPWYTQPLSCSQNSFFASHQVTEEVPSLRHDDVGKNHGRLDMRTGGPSACINPMDKENVILAKNMTDTSSVLTHFSESMTTARPTEHASISSEHTPHSPNYLQHTLGSGALPARASMMQEAPGAPCPPELRLCLVLNKCDSARGAAEALSVYGALGFPHMFPVSALHGRGMADLLRYVQQQFAWHHDNIYDANMGDGATEAHLNRHQVPDCAKHSNVFYHKERGESGERAGADISKNCNVSYRQDYAPAAMCGHFLTDGAAAASHSSVSPHAVTTGARTHERSENTGKSFGLHDESENQSARQDVLPGGPQDLREDFGKRHGTKVLQKIQQNNGQKISQDTLVMQRHDVQNIDRTVHLQRNQSVGHGHEELQQHRRILHGETHQVISQKKLQDVQQCNTHVGHTRSSQGAQQESTQEAPIILTIVGRPNVGKSSLVNALLGYERMRSGPQAGITTDAVHTPFSWRGHDMVLQDTAGLAKRTDTSWLRSQKVTQTGRTPMTLEQMACQDTHRALFFTHVAVVLLDATQPIGAQDMSIVHKAKSEGRAVIVGLNKWDSVTNPQKVFHHLPTLLSQMPVVPLSCYTKEGLTQLMTMVTTSYDQWCQRIPTAPLNRWLHTMLTTHALPLVRGRRIRIRYMTQISARPPTFGLFGNQLDSLPKAYQQYLLKGLSNTFGCTSPRLRLFNNHNPYHKP